MPSRLRKSLLPLSFWEKFSAHLRMIFTLLFIFSGNLIKISNKICQNLRKFQKIFFGKFFAKENFLKIFSFPYSSNFLLLCRFHSKTSVDRALLWLADASLRTYFPSFPCVSAHYTRSFIGSNAVLYRSRSRSAVILYLIWSSRASDVFRRINIKGY